MSRKMNHRIKVWVLPALNVFYCLFAFGQMQASSPKVSKYLDRFSEIAVSEMHRTGIPASIKLAQGLLESQWGESDLATLANNHFGIKCSKTWMGEMYFKEDDDFDVDGKLVSSCFRVFSSAEESYIAHSEFLMDPKKQFRYGNLFTLGSIDYKGWAYGLKEAGYATDPSYPEKLINIIEKYNLSKWDIEVSNTTQIIASQENKPESKPAEPSLNASIDTGIDMELINSATPKKSRLKISKEQVGQTPVKVSRKSYKIKLKNNLEFVTAVGGETIRDLANVMRIKVEDIISFNELIYHEFDVLPQGMPIYLERKNRNYYGTDDFHIVQEGDNMAYISQLYGIRQENLYNRNRLNRNEEPAPGEKIYLKKNIEEHQKPKTLRNPKNYSADEFLWVKNR